MFDIYHYPDPKPLKRKKRPACPKHQMELRPGTIVVRNKPVGCGDSGWQEMSIFRCPVPNCSYYQEE